MTDFEIVEFAFDQKSVVDWSFTNEIARDWPVVYILNNDKEVYVGDNQCPIATSTALNDRKQKEPKTSANCFEHQVQ